MSSIQQDIHTLSMRLSEVLDEIGVNHEMISMRREFVLYRENIHNIFKHMCNINAKVYYFGSKSEGSTTIGIKSDNDGLVSDYSYHVIHDWKDWKRGVQNLLMIQDDTTAAGYCLLQLLRDDEPIATSWIPDDRYHRDVKGRVLLKNTYANNAFADFGAVRHGPARSILGLENNADVDIVTAFHCEQWPSQGTRWLSRRSVSGWPSAHIKTKSEISGCFVVPVGSKISGLDETEWRISTSMAERYLMFSMNITQIRCCVLMKMLLKSYHEFKDVISSYMCKTALFHCIENTTSDIWQEHNLVECFSNVLRVLYVFIANKNCPHFIITENNLMANRISAEQQRSLQEVIQDIITSEGKVFFEIQIDDIGERLKMKFTRSLIHSRQIAPPEVIRSYISSQNCLDLAQEIKQGINGRIHENNNCHVLDTIRNFLCYFTRCTQQVPQCIDLEQNTISYILPVLCSTVGSLLVSYYTTKRKPFSNIVYKWLKLGLNSDVSSGWLKLATVCYSVGNMNAAEETLRHIDQHYNWDAMLPVCGCQLGVRIIVQPGNLQSADRIQITEMRQIVSYCICFMRCEVNVVPQEMRQEFHRSTPEDIRCRHKHFDWWMDLSVVDSLPYLYFLQYKTYGHLRKHTEQQRSLQKLQQVIRDVKNLCHRETALNLLGQCFEQENLPNDAFHCYERSLQVRPRNNAANFHMSRLLAK